MNLDEAENILGIVPGESGSVRTVRAAFARTVRAAHPDTAGTAPACGPAMSEIKLARDMLLFNLASRNKTCPLCDGHGTVRGRVGRKQCAACAGTGEVIKC